MSLAARVSGFFLATLALVLAGVSVTLYLLSSAHLHRDLDERLGLALDTLTTSVDVDPGRVEWNLGARPEVVVVQPDDDPGVLAGDRPRGNDGRSNVGRGACRPGGTGEACSEHGTFARNAHRQSWKALASCPEAHPRRAGQPAE